MPTTKKKKPTKKSPPAPVLAPAPVAEPTPEQLAEEARLEARRAEFRRLRDLAAEEPQRRAEADGARLVWRAANEKAKTAKSLAEAKATELRKVLTSASTRHGRSLQAETQLRLAYVPSQLRRALARAEAAKHRAGATLATSRELLVRAEALEATKGDHLDKESLRARLEAPRLAARSALDDVKAAEYQIEEIQTAIGAALAAWA